MQDHTTRCCSGSITKQGTNHPGGGISVEFHTCVTATRSDRDSNLSLIAQTGCSRLFCICFVSVTSNVDYV